MLHGSTSTLRRAGPSAGGIGLTGTLQTNK